MINWYELDSTLTKTKIFCYIYFLPKMLTFTRGIGKCKNPGNKTS